MNCADYYTVEIDGKSRGFNGREPAGQTEQFQIVLFDSGPIDEGPHEVVLRNTPTVQALSEAGQTFLDLDAVSRTRHAAPPNDVLRSSHSFQQSGIRWSISMMPPSFSPYARGAPVGV